MPRRKTQQLVETGVHQTAGLMGELDNLLATVEELSARIDTLVNFLEPFLVPEVENVSASGSVRETGNSPAVNKTLDIIEIVDRLSNRIIEIADRVQK